MYVQITPFLCIYQEQSYFVMVYVLYMFLSFCVLKCVYVTFPHHLLLLLLNISHILQLLKAMPCHAHSYSHRYSHR